MKNFATIYAVYLLITAAGSFPAAVACMLRPTRFRTNNLQNPLAIASNRPVFSWALAFQDGGYTPPEGEVGVDHHQTAYRIVCTELREDGKGQILWDSGKVQSQETLQIEYSGKQLESLQRIQWKVQVWDEHGEECGSSSSDAGEIPWFETGLLDENAWGGAEWIARFGTLPSNVTLCSMMAETDENQVPRFRATLDHIPKDIVQARAYIVGLGYYQMFINGEKVGDAMLDTGWTTYSKRVLYASHDVTSLLQKSGSGKHAVGVELGNGWWNPHPILIFKRLNLRIPLISGQNMPSSRPMFRLQIYGFNKNGSVVSLLKSSTGEGWLSAGSPTVSNDIYLGEKYDARMEPFFDGWTTASYHARTNNFLSGNAWRAPVRAHASGLGKIEAQEIPPVKRQKTLKTTMVSQKMNGEGGTIAIFDTAINHAGSCRIQLVKNEGLLGHGQSIYLRYGELLTKEGELNVFTSVAGHITDKNPDAPCQPDVAAQQDTIILGTRSVDWTPSWSWHGFRYIEVTLPPTVHLSHFSLECFTMRTDVEVVADFSSSDSWLSSLRELVRNTYDSNLMSIQSDCPHRERFGYGGDALGAGEAGLSIYDFSAFYRKRVLDYNDAQHVSDSTGNLTGFTETSPAVDIETAGLGLGTGPIGWETFQPEAQLWLYKYYGDTRTMNESIKNTRAYIDLLDSEPEGIEKGLGDWLAVHSTDVAYTGLGFQQMSYLAFANITEILGLPSSIPDHYRLKAEQVVKKINDRFMRADGSGAYSVGVAERSGNVTQTGQGMALFNGLLSSDTSMRKKALSQLAANVRSSSYIKGACQPFGPSSFQPECDAARGGPGPHLTAGLMGIKWVLMALADGGLNDLAYDIVSAKTYPGYGWMMNNQFANATTIWESFYFSDFRKSHNHPMFGSTEVWILQSVAGIQPHPSARGMDHILIRPNPPTQLQHASASFESPRGVTTVTWERKVDDKAIDLNVTIPPNCRATVYIPCVETGLVLHQGKHVSGRWAPAPLAQAGFGSVVLDIGSGFHVFQSYMSADVIDKRIFELIMSAHNTFQEDGPFFTKVKDTVQEDGPFFNKFQEAGHRHL